MKIIQKYSHLYGEEFLLVHHPQLYKEIMSVVDQINLDKCKTKASKEKKKMVLDLYNPVELNNAFDKEFSSYGWQRDQNKDFVKDKISVEIHFDKHPFGLFGKHMLFYSGGIINLGIEILPTKKMQQQMSSGIAYFEGEVYNVMRQGRNNPPIPLLIIGIEP